MKKAMVGGKWMKVNGRFLTSCGCFAYDGCHKIYVCETKKEAMKMLDMGYELRPIENLERVYKESCPLKFISSADLTFDYCPQCRKARFTYVNPKKGEKE